MYVYLQPGGTLQGVVCKLAALRGGGQQPCPPAYMAVAGSCRGGSGVPSAATGLQRCPAIRFHPPPRSGLPRWPQQQLARCAPPRCRGSPSFVWCSMFASGADRGRTAARQRFPRTTSGRAPATIASRNITWRAPTSRGARPCPELVQGGRLARQLSCGRCRGAVLSARRGAQRRSNLKMTARRSRSPRLRGAAPLTKEAGRGDEENQGRQKPVITMLPLVRSIFNFNYTHYMYNDRHRHKALSGSRFAAPRQLPWKNLGLYISSRTAPREWCYSEHTGPMRQGRAPPNPAAQP